MILAITLPESSLSSTTSIFWFHCPLSRSISAPGLLSGPQFRTTPDSLRPPVDRSPQYASAHLLFAVGVHDLPPCLMALGRQRQSDPIPVPPLLLPLVEGVEDALP